jgi:hypothetical protein
VNRIEMITGLFLVWLLIIPINVQGIQVENQYRPAATGISLTVDFGNGTIVNFTGLSAPNVYNLTIMIFDVDASWAGNLVYINAIDGVYRDQVHGWQYWVNGNYATVAANLYILQDGDSVLWNLTTSQYQSVTEPDYTSLVGGAILGIAGVIFLALLYRRTKRR